MLSTMTFDDALLSSYLLKHLQPLTQADPNLLARYVAALLKHNKPKKELEAFCVDKLSDFLGDESESFVQDLFEAFEKGTMLASKVDCYTKVAESASTVPVSVTARMTGNVICNGVLPDRLTWTQYLNLPETDKGISGNLMEEEGSDDEDDDRNHKHRRRVCTPRSLESDRYCQDFSLEEHGKPAIIDGWPMYVNSISAAESPKGLGAFCVESNGLSKGMQNRNQAYKSPIRNARESNPHNFLKGVAVLRGNGLGPRFEFQNGLTREGPGSGKGTLAEPWIGYEPKTALDGHGFNLSLLPLGLPSNPYSGHGNALQSSWAGFGQFPGVRAGLCDNVLPLNQVMQSLTVGRSRCPDFEERGYCLRGDLCPMDHGANRIVVEDVQSLSKFNLPFAIPSGLGMTLSSSSMSPRLSNPILFTRDVSFPMDESSFLKGTLTINASSEPDLYDPDQPLLNKQQPAALAGRFKRLSSLRKDLEADEGNLAVLKRHKGQSLDEGKFEAFLSVAMPYDFNQEQSVWNNARGYNHDDNNAKSSTHLSDGHLKAKGAVVVENYFPDSVPGMHENHHQEEQESLVKTALLKVETNCAPQGEVGLCRASLKSHGRLSIGPQGERSQRTLYVGCIPKDNRKKELLKSHFQKFGEVVDVRIPLQGDRAFVQFSQREEAEAALRSPEAVMGNRFIRLSWAKRDSVPFTCAAEHDLAAPLKTGNSQNVVLEGSHEALSMKAKQPTSLSALSEPNALPTTGKAIISSFQTIASTSSLKKQQELELMMEDLRRKQDELARKRGDFRRQLERYSKQGFHGDRMSNDDSKAESKEDQSSSKKQTLEKLEAGINKSHKEISALSASIEKALLSADQSDSSIVKDSVKISLGPPQAQSSAQLLQRGLKCSLVGTSVGFAGASQQSSMHYRLDNRTTAFHVLPPFPDGLVDISAFMEHFSRFGDVSNVEVDDVNKGVKVTFYTRSAAEKAFLQGRCYQGTSLSFSWVKQSSSVPADALSDGTATFDAICGNSSHHVASQ